MKVIKRRTALLAVLVGGVGTIVKAQQERVQQLQWFSSSDETVTVAEMQEAYRNWIIVCPKKLTIEDPDTGTSVVLTVAEIMAALRGE